MILRYFLWQPALSERIPSGPLRLEKCEPGGILCVADTEDERGRVAYFLACMPGIDGRPCLVECDAAGNPLAAVAPESARKKPAAPKHRDTPEARPPRERARKLRDEVDG